jgi:hypothetical protein
MTIRISAQTPHGSPHRKLCPNASRLEDKPAARSRLPNGNRLKLIAVGITLSFD